MTVDAADRCPPPCPGTGDLHSWVCWDDGSLECLWCSRTRPLVPPQRRWTGHVFDPPGDPR
ncbi:hypothetical protein JOF53_004203 [Crossiella equi]|uniref:Uncharacterized protein n=1 Tax=Crossiella equi TaxID=130796 RepID=A0ABS5AFG8_9PSEU|nr:hypothetical protein [Crossiella equi]MBP2475331.1 hypothetical protein [Crossiella equi]